MNLKKASETGTETRRADRVPRSSHWKKFDFGRGRGPKLWQVMTPGNPKAFGK